MRLAPLLGRVGLVLAAAMALAGPASGITTTWQSSGGYYSGTWENAAHWTGGVVPNDASYDCVFPQPAVIYYCELSQNHTVASCASIRPSKLSAKMRQHSIAASW